MKRTLLLLALTLGCTTFSAPGQSQGDAAKQLKDPPARNEGGDLRAPETRAERKQLRRGEGMRAQRGEAFGRRQMQGELPEPQSPQRRFAPGQRFGEQRGPAWGGPQARTRPFGPRPEVCPHCNRPFDVGPARGPLFRDRQGFGPREGMGGMRRGVGPQARGPAFGPPPWAGRGESDRALRPGPLGPRADGPLPEREFAPMQRGPWSPDGEKGRIERREREARRDGRVPRERGPGVPE